MMEESTMPNWCERIAALDLGKAGLEHVCECPSPTGQAGGCRSCAATAPPRHNCWRWWPGYGIGACSG